MISLRTGFLWAASVYKYFEGAIVKIQLHNSIILKDYFCPLKISVFFVFGSFLGQSEFSPEVS